MRETPNQPVDRYGTKPVNVEGRLATWQQLVDQVQNLDQALALAKEMFGRLNWLGDWLGAEMLARGMYEQLTGQQVDLEPDPEKEKAKAVFKSEEKALEAMWDALMEKWDIDEDEDL